MMKRGVVFILFFCIMAMSLAACKENEKETPAGDNRTETNSTVLGIKNLKINGQECFVDLAAGLTGYEKAQGGIARFDAESNIWKLYGVEDNSYIKDVDAREVWVQYSADISTEEKLVFPGECKPVDSVMYRIIDADWETEEGLKRGDALSRFQEKSWSRAATQLALCFRTSEGLVTTDSVKDQVEEFLKAYPTYSDIPTYLDREGAKAEDGELLKAYADGFSYMGNLQMEEKPDDYYKENVACRMLKHMLKEQVRDGKISGYVELGAVDYTGNDGLATMLFVSISGKKEYIAQIHAKQADVSVESILHDVVPEYEEVTLEIEEEKDLEGFVIEDNDTFSVSIDGIREAFMYPQAVAFSCMNKGDHHMAIAVTALSVNGCALGNQLTNLWEKEEGEFAILYPEELQEKYAANGVQTVRFMLTAYLTGDTDVADPETQESAFYKKFITIKVKNSKETEIVTSEENIVQIYDCDFVNVSYRLQENNNRTIYVENKLERPIYIDFSDVLYIPSYSEYPVQSRIIYYDQRMCWDDIDQGVKMHSGSYVILPGDRTELKMEVIDKESTEIKNVSYRMAFSYADLRYADSFYNVVAAAHFGETLFEANIEE